MQFIKNMYLRLMSLVTFSKKYAPPILILDTAAGLCNQMMDIEKDSILDNALILEGLNSENAYHIIWEAVIPAFSILLEDGDLPRDPSEAAQYFQDNNWSIIWMDFDSLTSTLNDNWWKELLPTIRNPTRGPMYLVRRLIIGTNGRCAHYGTSVFGESLFDPFYPNHTLQS
jgi:hypothetical protein